MSFKIWKFWKCSTKKESYGKCDRHIQSVLFRINTALQWAWLIYKTIAAKHLLKLLRYTMKLSSKCGIFLFTCACVFVYVREEYVSIERYGIKLNPNLALKKTTPTTKTEPNSKCSYAPNLNDIDSQKTMKATISLIMNLIHRNYLFPCLFF